MKHLKWLIVATLFLIMFLPQQTLAAGFKDVPTSHWAYQSITKLTNANIINGYSDNTYKPETHVTRAQAAKILAYAIQTPLTTSFKPSYTDVPTSHWAYREIAALTEKGIFSNATKFNPNSYLTRAEMSKILTKGYRIIVDNNHEVSFKDVSPAGWDHPYVTTLAEVEISTGYSPLYYKPAMQVTRAQMAVFLDRAITFDQKRNSGVIKYDAVNKTYTDSSISIVNETAKQTARLVNLERAKIGLPSLAVDGQLSKIATIKAEDMNKNDYFAHKSPTYGEPWDMAEHFGYSYRSFGENIAYGQQTPEEVVKAWMNSPGHKANILSKSYTNIGAGIAKNSQGRIYWVHMFSSK